MFNDTITYEITINKEKDILLCAKDIFKKHNYNFFARDVEEKCSSCKDIHLCIPIFTCYSNLLLNHETTNSQEV